MSFILIELEKRLNLRPFLDAARSGRHPGYLAPASAPPYSLGRLTLILLFILTLTGMALTFFYAPSADEATSSIQALRQSSGFGWVIHNLHRWSALLILVTVVLHALRIWVQQAYSYPRDLNWWIGIAMLGAIALLGGTGYILRWDIKSFTLLDLVVSTFAHIPVLGTAVVNFILGSTRPDVVPLFRGYAWHIWFLPLVLGLLVILHLLIAWRQGLAAGTPTSKLPKILGRTTPRFRWLPAIVMLMGLLGLALLFPEVRSLDPMFVSPWPQPDWLLHFYLLPFWIFSGKTRFVGAFIIPAAVGTWLILAPRISRTIKGRSLTTVVVVIGVLGVLSMFIQVSSMGVQVPLQGCPVCHQERMIGGAPTRLSEFEIRDADWIVNHLRDPLVSILEPYPEP